MVNDWADVWQLEDFSNAYKNWMLDSMGRKEFSILFDLLHETEFRWNERKFPRDSDRADDGRYLRLRFSNESGMELREEWLLWECSFLEFLISLAYSIDDQIMYDPVQPDGPRKWFWTMMHNCGLDIYNDDKMLRDSMLAYMSVSGTVNMIMERRYENNGYPGLFPLKRPEMDQRDVEIWYQANAYFIEEFFDEEL